MVYDLPGSFFYLADFGRPEADSSGFHPDYGRGSLGISDSGQWIPLSKILPFNLFPTLPSHKKCLQERQGNPLSSLIYPP